MLNGLPKRSFLKNIIALPIVMAMGIKIDFRTREEKLVDYWKKGRPKMILMSDVSLWARTRPWEHWPKT